MTNRRWIVSFALDLLLVSSFVAANRYQLRGRFDGESWNPQSPLSLATGSEASHQGIRRLLETGEMPNITETEPLSCLAVNGRISCTLAFAVNDPGTNDSSEMSVTTNCPGTDVDNFNLREAEGCFCQAQVSRDNTNGDACLCSICNDDRSEALVSVDCTPFGATVIDSCGSLDCNYGCNGNCISSCPAEAAQDPECPFCFVTESPSTTPTSSSPPTKSEAPSSMPSTQPTLSVPPSSKPTISVAPSLLPSISPSALPSGNPTISSQPTQSQSPSLTPSFNPSESPSVQPTLSQAPSVRPTLSQNPSSAPSKSPSSRPTISESPTPLETNVLLGLMSVPTTLGLTDPEELVDTLTSYLLQELQVLFPSLKRLNLVTIQDVDSYDIVSLATFSGGTAPSLEELLEAQNAALANEEKLVEFAPAAVDDFVVAVDVEGPAPLGKADYS